MSRDCYLFCKTCERFQRTGNISQKNQISQNPILVCEVFDVWGIDFMGPFSVSFSNIYILLAVEYISKWVEAKATRSDDAKTVIKFLKSNIFVRFGVPRALISDRGTHFRNKVLEALLRKLVFGKPCHLPVELEHRAFWAVKQCNFNVGEAGRHKKLQLQELEELRNDSYENSRIYKEKTKLFHDKSITRKHFEQEHKVLLYHSRLELFSGKLRSRLGLLL
uniref:Integrase catalytic domain-containing protein n=1 Tax=Lactuca sativa TaxID=4236 RepID=A0A9R1XYF6_LACSA|nr:hypothetical protein LSAT_V11C100040580 [Lactuca sativa]